MGNQKMFVSLIFPLIKIVGVLTFSLCEHLHVIKLLIAFNPYLSFVVSFFVLPVASSRRKQSHGFILFIRYEKVCFILPFLSLLVFLALLTVKLTIQVLGLSKEQLAARQVDFIDIAIPGKDCWSYLVGSCSMDFSKFKSSRTGRGPFPEGWQVGIFYMYHFCSYFCLMELWFVSFSVSSWQSPHIYYLIFTRGVYWAENESF